LKPSFALPRASFASITNQSVIDKDNKYVAHNYKSLPVALARGKGVHVWDVEGKKYIDFLAGYSASNQGHSHPKIIKAAYEQLKKVTQLSRAFHGDQMGETAEYLCKTFGYDMMLPMNTGVEAAETACKIARRWGYVKKGIPDNQAKIVMANGNFWGRSITASGACDDPSRYNGFGPFTPGFPLIDFNDVEAFKRALNGEDGKNICAIFLEPIQGEKGVIIPDPNYFNQISQLCKQHNVLLITDEI
jgi:ornithine--oxo-acid transaminase